MTINDSMLVQVINAAIELFTRTVALSTRIGFQIASRCYTLEIMSLGKGVLIFLTARGFRDRETTHSC
jgi:hypothetical protein